MDSFEQLKRDLAAKRIDRRTFMVAATAMGFGAAATTYADKAEAATPKKGGHLRIGTAEGSTSDNLDPAPDSSAFITMLSSTYMSQLTEVDAHGTLQPLLASRGEEFILFDGRPEHFIVQDNQLAGLIDLGEARSGDAAMDLGVLAVSDPDLIPGILAGYKAPQQEQEKLNQLIPFYTFLRRLAAISRAIETVMTHDAVASRILVTNAFWKAGS